MVVRGGVVLDRSEYLCADFFFVVAIIFPFQIASAALSAVIASAAVCLGYGAGLRDGRFLCQLRQWSPSRSAAAGQGLPFHVFARIYNPRWLIPARVCPDVVLKAFVEIYKNHR